LSTHAKPDVVSRQLDDRTVVVNLRTNRIYELNRTASRLWELLESGADRQEAERRMLAEFDVNPDELRAEIDRALEHFDAEGLTNGDAPG